MNSAHQNNEIEKIQRSCKNCTFGRGCCFGRDDLYGVNINKTMQKYPYGCEEWEINFSIFAHYCEAHNLDIDLDEFNILYID